MTLHNLLKIGQLREHPADVDEIRRLLAAAERNIADSKVAAVSPETRFDAAYKAIMQAALAALMAHGYRPDTKRPGHHMTVLQVLPHTVGQSSERLIVLDTLRRIRNQSDYTGVDVDESSARDFCTEAGRLLNDVISWLTANRPNVNWTRHE